MAKKISELSSAGALAGTESIPVVQSGATVKATAQAIANLANAYTDTAVAGRAWKQPVRVATTVAGTLATSFENGDTVDGVTLSTGDRILIKNQASATENGIYVVAASGAPSRATDADSGSELVNATVYVSEGTTNADTQWTCTANATITIGATNLPFAQSGTGSGSVTSVAASGGAQTTSGSAITTTGTIQTAHVINAQTGTTYAIASTDRGKHLTLSNASSIAASIAQAGTTGFEDGYYVWIEAIGAGAVTITPTTSTVNGASTLVLDSGMAAVLFSDGTNYRAFVFDAAGVPVNAQTGTTYTYLSGDRGKLVTHSNGSSIAGTLPQATGAFGAGWFMYVQNRGAGTLTITPTTSTIDGAASLALTTNQGVLIASDGTNYYTMRGVGGSSSGGTKTYAVLTPMTSQPPASNYATLDTRNSIAVLDFDASTDESATWVFILPESASLGSGLNVYIHWMATSATSGTCRWGAQLERMNTDLDSDSFDTAQTAGSATSGTSGIITVTTIALTTIDSATAGDAVRLKIYRDADGTSGTDDMAGDAELVAVEVRSAA